jgi:hypothetical protein
MYFQLHLETKCVCIYIIYIAREPIDPIGNRVVVVYLYNVRSRILKTIDRPTAKQRHLELASHAHDQTLADLKSKKEKPLPDLSRKFVYNPMFLLMGICL